MSIQSMAKLCLVAASFTGCSKGSPEGSPQEKRFNAARNETQYELIATTLIDGDRLEIWKEPESRCFGRMLVAAWDKAGRFVDFRQGQFVTSARPYYQTDRYAVLVASTSDRRRRCAFFVYDAVDKGFRALPGSNLDHVHDGIVVQGDRVFFSSCKSPEPVGTIDLRTGTQVMFGGPAPQGARFHLENSSVLIAGDDGLIYSISEDRLVLEQDAQSLSDPTSQNFRSLLVARSH